MNTSARHTNSRFLRSISNVKTSWSPAVSCLKPSEFRKKLKLLENIQVGDVREGIVKNITDFGVFLDLDGIDGLLHITDMTWKRIKHPSEMVQLGQKIEVMILSVDKDKGRVALRTEAKRTKSMGSDRTEISSRNTRQRQNCQSAPLWRLHRDRTWHRRADPRLRNVVGEEYH